MIAEASSVVDVETSNSNVWVRLVPRAWALTQKHASEIWVNRTIPEVIADKLDAIGLVKDVDFVFALGQQWHLIPACSEVANAAAGTRCVATLGTQAEPQRTPQQKVVDQPPLTPPPETPAEAPAEGAATPEAVPVAAPAR